MIDVMTLKFSQILEKGYLLWRGKQGEGKVGEAYFSEWLGIPPTTYSTWKTGKPPKDEKIIGRLARKFKELDKALVAELYESLGIDDPWEIETKNLIERYKDNETFYKAAQNLYDIVDELEGRVRKKKGK